MASVRNPDLGKLYWEERTRIVVWRVGSCSSGCPSCMHSTDCSSWISTLKSISTSTAGRIQVVSSPFFHSHGPPFLSCEDIVHVGRLMLRGYSFSMLPNQMLHICPDLV